MNPVSRFLPMCFLMLGLIPDLVHGEVKVWNRVDPTLLHHPPSIFVDVVASTWKTRGRLLYDVEGSVRRKLRSIGFSVVRRETEPHDLLLSIEYEEMQGKPYGIQQFGTIVKGSFRLESPKSGHLLDLVL